MGMSVNITIPGYLWRATNGNKTAKVHGNTVGDCLNKLVELFPPIGDKLLDKQGELLPYVEIYVSGHSARPEGLAKLVRDGDELNILFILGGG